MTINDYDNNNDSSNNENKLVIKIIKLIINDSNE